MAAESRDRRAPWYLAALLLLASAAVAYAVAPGAAPKGAFSMAPTWPFHVPQVLSLAFWGGVWGIFLWLAIARLDGAAYWLAALALGAIAPSVVALFVVFPLHGQPVAGGWDR